ncbi:MAG TPA: SDR family oxidoreductase [Stellaceae bacterium]
MPTVLVTGAGRGLGLEFARQYRADGWRVIGTVRDPGRAAELKSLGAEVHALDVTDMAAVARLGQALAGEAIDVAIANAGVYGPRDMTLDALDVEGWLDTFRVNTIAPVAVAAALRGPVSRSGGRKMAAITSRLGSIEYNREGGMYAYRSSKAALNAAWRSFAIDNPGIVAILLHPGWVRTDMGGPNADLSPAESVAGMRRVIAGAGDADSGRFFGHDGTAIPW